MRLTPLLLVLNAAGCATVLGHDPPREDIAAVEQSLCGPNFRLDERILSPAIIQSVEPSYGPIYTKSGQQQSLSGVQLRMLALPELTPQWINRTLRCHAARQILGREPLVPNDPYWLPGAPVEIRVVAEEVSFLVLLHTDGVDHARTLLERARAYSQRSSNP